MALADTQEVRARFAPSPTGDLHLGGAWTALASHALALALGGRNVLRVEDLDRPRVVAGSTARIVEDLTWLGLRFDEGPGEGPCQPYEQSARDALYEAALAALTAAGLTYPCDCSRAEIARSASAPHAGEEILYPRTCRDASPDRAFKRPPAVRLRVPAGTTVVFDDLARGRYEQRVDVVASDFVLRRGDGIFAYQLAVAVDDAAMRVSHVVRGDDLLASTPRQILLMRLLGASRIPAYAHVPLVVSSDGERLAKRARPVSLRDLRQQGVEALDVLRELAEALGLAAPEDVRRASSLDALAVHLLPPSAWRRSPWAPPQAWSK